MFGPQCLLGLGRLVGVNSLRLATVASHLAGKTSPQFCNKMAYSTIESGSPNTDSYRVFFRNEAGVPVSPFHDIPLYADKNKGVFNMVVEIPRWTNAKMEICKEEPLNPIKQDTKKGKLRFVKNIFPHKGYIWNYGALPQTYEDPEHTTPETGTQGDSDPIDVCEIGYKIHERGSVVQVKPVGVMCLIDDGETDWKVLAIDVTDPKADAVNDVEDLEKHFPGLLRATYEWFKYYKVPDDKPENKFAFDGECKNKEYALGVIEETFGQWQELVKRGGEHSIDRTNTCVDGSPHKVSAAEAEAVVEKADAKRRKSECEGSPADGGQDINKWYHVIPQAGPKA